MNVIKTIPGIISLDYISFDKNSGGLRMNQNKSLKKNTLYNAIKTFSSLIFPLITFPYISRVLLPENVGKVNFGLSVISYFSLVASLGITTYAIRECAAAKDNRDKLSSVASQIFSINVFTTILAYILLAFTLATYHKLDNYRTLIIIQSLSIVFTTLGADWLNSALEDFRYITIRTVAFQMLSLVLMFLFIHRPEDYIKYAVVSLVSSSGANIVNIWYRRRYCNVRFTTEIDWNKHLIPIMLLFVMILAQDIFSNVDSTMLGLMQGDRAVGIYTTAQKASRIVSQVISSILWVIMPRMSLHFANKNYNEINRLLRKLLGFNLILGLPCVIGLILMSKDIILIVAGNDFIEASPVLQIRAISLLFALFGGNLLGNAILLPSKQEKYYMIVCVITAFINIGTNYLLIPKYGPVGAAFTTAFCSFCIMVMLALRVDKHIKFQKIARLVVSPIVGCVAIVGVCFVFSGIDNLVLRVVLRLVCSTIIYGIIQLLLKNELACEIMGIVSNRLKQRKI